MSLTRMSGGGGGVGGPTVSHEPGVRNEPLLIAGVVDSHWSVASGGSISSSKTDNGAFPLVKKRGAVRDSVRHETHADQHDVTTLGCCCCSPRGNESDAKVNMRRASPEE